MTSPAASRTPSAPAGRGGNSGMDAFVGIDVAFAKRKCLPISICTWREGRLIPAELRRLPIQPPRGLGNAAILNPQSVRDFAVAARRYVEAACRELAVVPRRVAIDAPSSPRRDAMRRREAEVAMDRAGISCFATPTAASGVTLSKYS